jgi:hypothetical protein
VRVASRLALRVGVGEGVISVLAVISTSSASRYHFLRRVYRPHPSTPRRPFCHFLIVSIIQCQKNEWIE